MWEAVAALTGPCVALTPAALCWGARLQRLFFLNEGQVTTQSPFTPTLLPKVQSASCPDTILPMHGLQGCHVSFRTETCAASISVRLLPSRALLQCKGNGCLLCFAHGKICAQDLSRFLVADLGIMRYPAYAVARTRPVWPDRASLLAYERALAAAEVLDAALEVP